VSAPIYLDNNATTPLDEEVLEAMLPFLRGRFGNAASPHALGRDAREAVECARHSVAALIGAREGRLVFVASSTEANNLAILGVAAGADAPCHMVTTTVEHKSVIEPLKHLERTGRARVTWLRPDGFGQVHPEALEAAIDAGTRLVSIVAAGNVIHTLNPIGALVRVAADRGVLFHTDATQWVGRLPLDVEHLGLDLVGLSAHKFYGPKGAGALYLSPRAWQAGIVPQMLGGGQEEGLRSGTLNVPAIVGLGAACDLAARRQEADAVRARELGRRLLEGLKGRLGGVVLNGHPEERIPGGVHVTLQGVDGKGLIASVPEVAFSDGSACETDRDPDYVLKAIGKPEAAHHSLRFQVGRTTRPADIDAALEALAAGVRRMRAFEFC
jgi:cysteine desulfurase